jgi:hypothetical protein
MTDFEKMAGLLGDLTASIGRLEREIDQVKEQQREESPIGSNAMASLI